MPLVYLLQPQDWESGKEMKRHTAWIHSQRMASMAGHQSGTASSNCRVTCCCQHPEVTSLVWLGTDKGIAVLLCGKPAVWGSWRKSSRGRETSLLAALMVLQKNPWLIFLETSILKDFRGQNCSVVTRTEHEVVAGPCSQPEPLVPYHFVSGTQISPPLLCQVYVVVATSSVKDPLLCKAHAGRMPTWGPGSVEDQA